MKSGILTPMLLWHHEVWHVDTHVILTSWSLACWHLCYSDIMKSGILTPMLFWHHEVWHVDTYIILTSWSLAFWHLCYSDIMKSGMLTLMLYVSSKFREPLTQRHGVTFQKIWILKTSATLLWDEFSLCHFCETLNFSRRWLPNWLFFVVGCCSLVEGSRNFR